MPLTRPDILFIMTDQQRFDTIAALGNPHIYTPNLDRLVRRGIAFSNAYATCPVCVAARYMIRTGCEPATTRVFSNAKADPVAGQPVQMEARCGPFFGFISFVGPHPPLAPPIPFNRMYDPDRMPEAALGKLEEDHLDEEIPYMRYAVWGDAINATLTKIVKARYYGEITYLDHCFGRILDAIEARPNSENTLVCFFSDHGDLLGDHHGWQKQNFFEAACRVPFLLSWPSTLPAGTIRNELISLADLFGIATQAGGACQLREGMDVLKMLRGECTPREYLLGMVEVPGSHNFKVMVLTDEWKYIFMANGGREQLFNRRRDQNELSNCISSAPGIRNELYAMAVRSCRTPGAIDALNGDKFRAFPFRRRPLRRIYQFDRSRGVLGFPDKPEDALQSFDRARLKPVK